jgi:Raf kinase inhibitor-like YbhB/YbcL family protein
MSNPALIRLASILAAVSVAVVVGVSARAATRFTLTSPAFRSGRMIPRRYTCDGADVSPPLRWSNPPADTRSLAILVIDLDAHGFRHWLGWGLPPARRALATGQHPPHQGINGFGRRGYGGPCPPTGRHRYQFSLYALDAPTGPPFAGHVLAVARLTAVYAH